MSSLMILQIISVQVLAIVVNRETTKTWKYNVFLIILGP